jgi:hypothetical protein
MHVFEGEVEARQSGVGVALPRPCACFSCSQHPQSPHAWQAADADVAPRIAETVVRPHIRTLLKVHLGWIGHPRPWMHCRIRIFVQFKGWVLSRFSTTRQRLQ